MYHPNTPNIRSDLPIYQAQPPPRSASSVDYNGGQDHKDLPEVETAVAPGTIAHAEMYGLQLPASYLNNYTRHEPESQELLTPTSPLQSRLTWNRGSGSSSIPVNGISYHPFFNSPVSITQATRRPSGGQHRVRGGRVSRNETHQSRAGGQRQQQNKRIGHPERVTGDQEEANGYDDDDGKGSNKNSRSWACPFCVAHPQDHSPCWVAVMKRFNDLVQHLKRKHTVDRNLYCPQCYECFDTTGLRESHLGDCRHNAPQRFDVMDGEELDETIKRSKFPSPLDHKDRWFCLWRRLYPDLTPPGSPYADGPEYYAAILTRALMEPQLNEALPRLVRHYFGIDSNHLSMVQFVNSVGSAIFIAPAVVNEGALAHNPAQVEYGQIHGHIAPRAMHGSTISGSVDNTHRHGTAFGQASPMVGTIIPSGQPIAQAAQHGRWTGIHDTATNFSMAHSNISSLGTSSDLPHADVTMDPLQSEYNHRRFQGGPGTHTPQLHHSTTATHSFPYVAFDEELLDPNLC